RAGGLHPAAGDGDPHHSHDRPPAGPVHGPPPARTTRHPRLRLPSVSAVPETVCRCHPAHPWRLRHLPGRDQLPGGGCGTWMAMPLAWTWVGLTLTPTPTPP